MTGRTIFKTESNFLDQNKTKILRTHNKLQLLQQLSMQQIISSNREKVVGPCESDMQSITVCHIR